MILPANPLFPSSGAGSNVRAGASGQPGPLNATQIGQAPGPVVGARPDELTSPLGLASATGLTATAIIAGNAAGLFSAVTEHWDSGHRNALGKQLAGALGMEITPDSAMAVAHFLRPEQCSSANDVIARIDAHLATLQHAFNKPHALDARTRAEQGLAVERSALAALVLPVVKDALRAADSCIHMRLVDSQKSIATQLRSGIPQQWVAAAYAAGILPKARPRRVPWQRFPS